MKNFKRITRYFLKLVGFIFFFTPILFLILSLLGGLCGDPEHFIAPLAIMLVALAVASLNFYLSFFRPKFYIRNHGSLDGYQYVSGIPGIGTLLIIAGGIYGFGSVIIAVIGLFALSIDVGGLPWFLIAIWKDRSLWNGRRMTDNSVKES